MFHLGWCYESGQGVSHDYTQAIQWYRKIAALGHIKAMNRLMLLGRN